MSRFASLRAHSCKASALVALVLTLLTVFTPVATAHDVLVDSDPAEGQHYEHAPTSARLTFNNELLDLGAGAAAAVVQNAAGEQVAELPFTLDGRDAIADLPALADGDYKLAWSVVSSDGHRIQGIIHFSIGAGATSPADTNADEPNAPANSTDAIANAFPTWGMPIIAAGIIASIVLLILQLKRKKS